MAIDSVFADLLARLDHCVQSQGWEAGLETFLKTATMTEAFRVRQDLAMTHTTWMGLLSPRAGSHGVLVESGLGAAALTASRFFDRLSVYCPNEQVVRIANARCRFQGAKNDIRFYTLDQLLKLEDQKSVDSLIVYEDNHCLNWAQRRVLISLLDPAGSLYWIYRDRGFRARLLHGGCEDVSGIRKFRHFLEKPRRKIHIATYVGDTRHPFEFRFNNRHRPLSRLAATIKNEISGRPYLLSSRDIRDPDSTFGRILASANKLVGTNRRYRLDRLIAAKPNGIILGTTLEPDTSDRRMIRVPFDALTAERFATNYRAMEYLGSLHALSDIPVPDVHGRGELDDFPYFIEENVNGCNVETDVLRSNNRFTAYGGMAIEYIQRIHKQTRRLMTIDEDYLDNYLMGGARGLFRHIHDPVLRKALQDIESYLYANLAGVQLPCVYSHGDYSVDNVLVNPDTAEITGLIDWEYGRKDGLPLVDVYLFLSSRYERVRDISPSLAYTETAVMGNFNQTEQHWLDHYCKILDLDQARLSRPLALAGLFQFLSSRLRINQDYALSALYEKLFAEVIKRCAAMVRQT